MTNPMPNVILRPDPRLPLLVVAFGAALLPLPGQPWPTLVVVLFGLFLLIQTASLRLEFEELALIVWQNGRELRRFPYEHWLAWRLFAPLAAGIVLLSRNQKHSLSAHPVQPKRAKSTARTTGWRTRDNPTAIRKKALNQHDIFTKSYRNLHDFVSH